MHAFTNLQLTCLVMLHIVLWVVLIFGIGYLLGDRLDKKHPFSINESSRQMIFLGVPAIGFAMLICEGETIAPAVGERAYPYVFFGLMAFFLVCGFIAYNAVPKKWVLPFGIAGWITMFSWVFWYLWFGRHVL